MTEKILTERAFSDAELVGVFSSHADRTQSGVPLFRKDEISGFAGKADVIINCAGSAKDLPEITPYLARDFNVIDSYDDHKNIAAHYVRVNTAAKTGGKLAMISCGWDPGLFSVFRALFSEIMPDSIINTFWGRGVSQGHSNAIRKINGVKDARQYTVPDSGDIERALNGSSEKYDSEKAHKRVCYVVAEDGASSDEIREKIITMPGYFSGYDTQVFFISESELKEKHSALPHAGYVISNGVLCGEKSTVALSLKISSNPCFTAAILISCTRALMCAYSHGMRGCITPFDVPLSYFCGGDTVGMTEKYM